MSDLRQAAQAVVDRWDSPLWKAGSTADAIADLRTALEQQQAEPVAFLAEGMRFKVALTDRDCKITGLPRAFGGRWVALVAAENDCHLRLIAPPQQQAEPVLLNGLTEAETNATASVTGLTKQAEPVAWMYPSDLEKFQQSETFAQAFSIKVGCPDEVSVPLYTTPPRPNPLTDEAIEQAQRDVWRSLPSDFDYTTSSWIEIGIRYAEAAHGIKEGA